jgi:hypothetical protein
MLKALFQELSTIAVLSFVLVGVALASRMA